MRDETGASLGEERYVRGYVVRRMPLGAFWKAARVLARLPEQVLEALVPGEGPEEALKALKGLTVETAVPVLARALTALPEPIVYAVSALTGVPTERLLGDPALGPEGLMALLEAAWEVNELGNFIKAARRMSARLRASGCKG